MARTRAKLKGRREAGQFLAIPHAVMTHPDWLQLSPNAIRLLLELGKQYNGRNNGDLTAAWAVMQKRGFRSESTLSSALNCLLANNFITRTREGQFANPGKRCALYALNWQPINACPGKQLDVNPTAAPPRTFALENRKPAPETGATGYKNHSQRGKYHAHA